MVQTWEGARTYWHEMAAIYCLMGAPLRPCREDIQHLQQLAARHAPVPAGGVRALMLGVTPAVAAMAWPGRTRLLAVDASAAMVKGVWPGDVAGVRWAVRGEWTDLPVAHGSCQLVTGDGSGNCVRFPEGLRKLAAEAARVLDPAGCLLLRCYCQPERKEDPAEVMRGLWDGEDPSFHHFKFRLLMAMQQTARGGVRLGDVYRYWAQSGTAAERLAEARGWEVSAIQTIDAYRDSPTVHAFPTLAEFRSVFGDYFVEASCSSAAYPLAGRCPVLALKPRGRAAPENGSRENSPCPA